MSHNPIRSCCIQHCENDVHVTAKALKDWGAHPPCYSCRGVYRYWIKRGVDAVVAREIVVLRAADRMAYTRSTNHSKPKRKKP